MRAPVRRSPAVEKACALLETVVDDTRAAGRVRLPPVRLLAVKAGVSKLTMQRAIARLKERGVVHAARGRWVEIVNPIPHAACVQHPAITVPVSSWQRLGARIAHDCVKTLIPPDQELPSLRELQKRYGASYQTVVKALRYLQEQGCLVEQGRRWSFTPAPGRTHGTIVLLARGEESGELVQYQPWGQQSLHTLEEECYRRASLTFETIPVYFVGTAMRWGERLDALLQHSRAGNQIGFILWCTAILPDVLERLTRLLNRSGRPVAILDEDQYNGATRSLPAICRHTPTTALFSIVNGTRPGQDVGRYLVECGHRSVVYVSLRGSYSWARRRYQGMAEVFALFGYPGGVTSFEVDETDLPAGEAQLPFNAARVLEPYMPINMSLLDNGSFFEDSAMRGPLREVSTLLLLGRLRALLFPVFDTILRSVAATAWVGQNDMMALSMIDFLTMRGYRVPHDMSVVGFDNSSGSFVQNMTSYDFNASAAFRAMVAHLLTPSRTLAAHATGKRIEIDGFLRRRRTSGPPRGGSGTPPFEGTVQERT